MGHYLGELMCDDCHQLSCRCKRKPQLDETAEHWIVSEDSTVVRAKDYQKQHDSHGFGFYTRMLKPHFANKAEAEKAAKVQLLAGIAETKKDLAAMEKQLAQMVKTSKRT